MRRAAEERGEAREENLQVKTNGDYVRLDLVVKPFRQEAFENCLMIVFEEKAFPVQEPEQVKDREDDSGRVAELEQELAKLQQDYRKAVEELEASNEELRSLNEEMNSSNEELQSTNEELESSREELQSLNEELNTVNTELQSNIEETEEAFNAVNEVLNSTRIALVFLDRKLCVERFTREAGDLVNLIENDIGRPLDHISHRLEDDRLNEKVKQVLDTLAPVDEEVQTTDGSWYRMRILVRYTGDHEVQGVVLTFVNIDAQKKAMAQLEENEKKFRALVEASSEVLFRMNGNWSEMRQLHSRGILSDTKTPTRDWLQKYIPADEQPRVTAAVNKAIETKSVFELAHRVYRKDGSPGRILSRAVPITGDTGEIKEWFGTASDITDRTENGQGQGSPPGDSR
jgi:two-component system CheB/CheR fusion protein